MSEDSATTKSHQKDQLKSEAQADKDAPEQVSSDKSTEREHQAQSATASENIPEELTTSLATESEEAPEQLDQDSSIAQQPHTSDAEASQTADASDTTTFDPSSSSSLPPTSETVEEKISSTDDIQEDSAHDESSQKTEEPTGEAVDDAGQSDDRHTATDSSEQLSNPVIAAEQFESTDHTPQKSSAIDQPPEENTQDETAEQEMTEDIEKEGEPSDKTLSKEDEVADPEESTKDNRDVDDAAAALEQTTLSQGDDEKGAEESTLQEAKAGTDTDKESLKESGERPAAAVSEPLVSPPLPSKQATLPPPPVPSKPTRDEQADSQALEGSKAVDTEREAVARAFGVAANSSSSTGPQPAQSRSTSPKGKDEEPEPKPEQTTSSSAASAPTTSSSKIKVGKGPPPTTNPEEEKPFDFNTFLDQMKDTSARGVGEYVRSFIRGFSKKPYRTVDQIKLIFDFLDFISERMRQCTVWSKLSEAEFENAREAMEKLVMNRLYNFTFTPAVAKEGRWTPQTDDLERDRVLRERIELFSWLKEEHLDVPTGDHSRGFVEFAIQELLKINHYKAPRDKLICILNCCKVIFGLIRHMSSEENADTFIPVLIFVVLKASPEHLISNVEYIGRFRNPDKLSSESGYYLSSLMGATAFIETMDYSSLSNISQEEFEKNVEEAVAKMAERPAPPPVASASTTAHFEPVPTGNLLAPPGQQARGVNPTMPGHTRSVGASDPHAPLGVGEGSATNLPGPNPPSFTEDTRAFLQRTGEAARLGFTTSLGKPIGALGKLLGEGLEGIKTPSGPGASGSGVNSSTASPARVDSPGLAAAFKLDKGAAGGMGIEGTRVASGAAVPSSTPRKGGVFSSFFGGESSSSPSQSSGTRATSGSSSTSTPGQSGVFNPGSWGRSFRGNDPAAYDDDIPHTPTGGDHRQGPFSSLVRNPQYSDAVPPGRKIGETPYAPKAHRSRPGAPERSDSLDPFNSPDPSSGDEGTRRGVFASSHLSNRADDGNTSSEGIGTPSDDGSDLEDDHSTQRSRSRLPDLGSFVPNFLSENTQRQQFAQGPRSGHPGQIGDSSMIADSSSDSNEMEIARMQEGEFLASMETLKSVFPDTDEEVRRMILEDCNGDVGQAIDRLLEINQG
ncbi:unnamed protein product [Sympodiomycopsis kandeliae]